MSKKTTHTLADRRYKLGVMIAAEASKRLGPAYDTKAFNETVKLIKTELSEFLALDYSTINRDIRILHTEGGSIPRARVIAYASFFHADPDKMETPKPSKSKKQQIA